MLTALQSLVLGTLLTAGPSAATPVDVTLVAGDEQADRIARLLAPRLTDAGYRAVFRRCDDFTCVRAPQPGDGLGVIVVVSERADDTLVIVTRDDGSGGVVVDEVPVAEPRTTLDGEALGFAVTRGLAEPPRELQTAWSVARREGMHRAPPPEPVATETSESSPPVVEPAKGDARPTTFLQISLGGGAAIRLNYGTSYPMGGPAFGLEAGAVWNPLRRLRIGIGGGLAHSDYGSAISNTSTDFLGKARIGVGTSRLWAYGIVGAGMSLVTRPWDYEVDRRVGPTGLGGLGVRGYVGDRISLGLDVESTIVAIPPVGRVTRFSGLFVVEIRFGK